MVICVVTERCAEFCGGTVRMPNIIHDPDEFKCKNVCWGGGRESWKLTRRSGIFTELKR